MLIAGIVLQIFDLSTFIKNRVNWIKQPIGYESIEESEWDKFENQYKHIYIFEETNWHDISIYAATHNKTMNIYSIDNYYIASGEELNGIKQYLIKEKSK